MYLRFQFAYSQRLEVEWEHPSIIRVRDSAILCGVKELRDFPPWIMSFVQSKAIQNARTLESV